MIALDREQAHAETIRLAGANPIGERGGLVWFTDPITKSTLVLEPEILTEFNVMKRLAESRIKFAGNGLLSQFYRRPGVIHDARRS